MSARVNPFATPYSTREDHYAEPKWPRVRVRAKKPFFWRETLRVRGVELPMGETRRVEVGEVLEVIAPDAQSLVGAGRAEYVR